MSKQEERLKAWKDYAEKMALRRGDTKSIVHITNLLEAAQAAKDYYLHLSEKYGDMEEMSIEKEN